MNSVDAGLQYMLSSPLHFSLKREKKIAKSIFSHIP